MSVLLFGPARDAVTPRSKVVFTNVGRNRTVSGVRAGLASDYPQLAQLLPRSIFALNEQYVALDRESTTHVKPNDEVALIPPISGHGALPTASQHQQRRSAKRPETRRLDRRPSRSFRALRSRHKSPYLALPWMPAGVLTTDDVSSSVLSSYISDSDSDEMSPRLPQPKSEALLRRGFTLPDLSLPRLTNFDRVVWDATIVDNNKESEAEGEVVGEEAEEADAAARLTVLEQFALLRLAEKRSRSQRALVDPRAWRVCTHLKRQRYSMRKSEAPPRLNQELLRTHESLLGCG
ncbi:hypothetical protein FOZ61_008428 [Perkinsus olseni]|uniref:Molybdopterin synthase sulfur carrier subunit n=1 Tax=Perkinsus olseni TaxID=32597 RepID=A0A7J6L3V4_PEROL|nr:hypothetical protein FOZ61_008428 [Perkinsus olseni]